MDSRKFRFLKCNEETYEKLLERFPVVASSETLSFNFTEEQQKDFERFRKQVEEGKPLRFEWEEKIENMDTTNEKTTNSEEITVKPILKEDFRNYFGGNTLYDNAQMHNAGRDMTIYNSQPIKDTFMENKTGHKCYLTLRKSEFTTVDAATKRFIDWFKTLGYVKYALRDQLIEKGKKEINTKWSDEDYFQLEIAVCDDVTVKGIRSITEKDLQESMDERKRARVRWLLELVRNKIVKEMEGYKDKEDWFSSFNRYAKKGELKELTKKIKQKYPPFYEDVVLPMISTIELAPIFGVTSTQGESSEYSKNLSKYELERLIDEITVDDKRVLTNNNSFESAGVRKHICIITALPTELQRCKEVLTKYANGHFENKTADYDFVAFEGTIFENIQVFMSSQSEYNDVNAAQHAEHVLYKFKPVLAVMVGICAGNPKKVHYGDVVVASKTTKWDFAKTEEEGTKRILNSNILNSTLSLSQNLQSIHLENDLLNLTVSSRPKSYKYFGDRFLLYFNKEFLENASSEVKDDVEKAIILLKSKPDVFVGLTNYLLKIGYTDQYGKTTDLGKKYLNDNQINLEFGAFPYNEPKKNSIHIGTFATTSQVQKNGQIWREISKVFTDFEAVDMEGNAFVSVAQKHSTLQLLVKGVTDYADVLKDDQYFQYAADCSVSFVLNFIKKYKDKILNH